MQSVNIIVPIDADHCIVLEPAVFEVDDGTVTYSSGSTGYCLLNADLAQYSNWSETLSYWVSADSFADYLGEFDGTYGGEHAAA